jgi:hypothetical protein
MVNNIVMDDDPSRQQTSPLRSIVRWTWVIVALAVLYTGWIVVSRWRENRAIEAEAARKTAEADRQIVGMYGSGELKMLMFYANPGTLKRGSMGLLCYGVANAKSVRIVPGVEDIKPSLSRCIEVKPKADTHYTFSADDGKGRTVSQSVDVLVR